MVAGMEFRVLGPLEVWAAGRVLALGGLRQRRVLAALLLHPNQVVPLARLIDAAWDEDAPPTAPRQVRNRVAALRKVLTPAGGFIHTEPAGYRLPIGPHALDLAVFEDLVRRGREAHDAGLLRQGLARWRGPALAELGGLLLGQEAARLEEQRLAVWEECLDLELAAGAYERVVADSAPLVAAHPLRERLVGQLMTALAGCDRPDEALAAYRELADRLAGELGIDPSPALRQLREKLMRSAPEVPAQLPRDVPGFTGRLADLARLDQLLSDGQAGRPVVISAIAGTAGVGKTALAVHWAHRTRDKFPDGQLYVNLRGFDPTGSVVAPADALRRFLAALQVPPARLPADLHEQAALYRGLLAGKRMLVVLDNARDADQVRPLLPGAPGCVVVVTSRHRLTSLVTAERAHPINLDLLSEAEARQLLVARLGAGRVAAEPDAVDDIITRCARLPLALAIVAARAATHLRFPLAALAGELRQARGGLGPFTGEDPRTDVRAVFSWSYHALGPPAARLFRLLGLHPGPDLGAPAAASLAGVPLAQVRALLAELTGAHLITEHTPGRYAFHDLLRAYAAEQAEAVDSDAERHAATHRILDHYLHTAHGAARTLNPFRDPIAVPEPGAGVTVVDLSTIDPALAWLDEQQPVLLAAIDHAAASGFDRHTWQLVWAVGTFLGRRGYWQEWIAAQTTAVAAARRLADRPALAAAHHGLAAAYTRLDRYEDAYAHFRHALELFTALDDVIGMANTHHGLTFAFERESRYRQALHHARAAVELFRTADRRDAQAAALNAVGWCHAQLGDHAQALTCCRDALALLQDLGDRLGQAATWDSLGYAHHHVGDHDRATACYEAALDLYREFGDRLEEASTLARLGDTYSAAGNTPAARDAWRQALAIFSELGHPDADQVRARLDRHS
jgi:DNA-binding SARP family transcriptional activator/tetratricopeptide (TPR) repeat protein